MPWLYPERPLALLAGAGHAYTPDCFMGILGRGIALVAHWDKRRNFPSPRETCCRLRA